MYSIRYYNAVVMQNILELPDTLAARYVLLSHRMLEHGSNLGPPHTESMGDGLFELRLKGAEGIARVFFCTLIGKQIMVLHSYVKKTQKTPRKELEIARARMHEVKNGRSR